MYAKSSKCVGVEDDMVQGSKEVCVDDLSVTKDLSSTDGISSLESSSHAGKIDVDLITTLRTEVVLKVFSFMEPRNLVKLAQTCHIFRFLAEDNTLWKKKSQEENLPYCLTFMDEKLLGSRMTMNSSFQQILKDLNMELSSFEFSQWKASYLKHTRIEKNYRQNPVRKPMILSLNSVRPDRLNRPIKTSMEFVGNKLVSISDNTLKIWYPLNGICIRTLEGHTDKVSTIKVDNHYIISGSFDTNLKLWNSYTGECIQTFRGHTQAVWCTDLNGGSLISGSYDGTVRMWNLWEGTCVNVLRGHFGVVRSVQFNGNLVASGSHDCTVKIWNPELGECLHTFVSHTGFILDVKFAGLNLLSSSVDNNIRVWDVEAGVCRYKLLEYAPMWHMGFDEGVTELHGNIFVSGHNSSVKIWDTRTWNCLQTLDGTKISSKINTLDFNDKFVVTGSLDGKVQLWDIKTGNLIRDLIVIEQDQVGKIMIKDEIIVFAIICRNEWRMNAPVEIYVLNFDVNE